MPKKKQTVNVNKTPSIIDNILVIILKNWQKVIGIIAAVGLILMVGISGFSIKTPGGLEIEKTEIKIDQMKK